MLLGRLGRVGRKLVLLGSTNMVGTLLVPQNSFRVWVPPDNPRMRKGLGVA